MDAGYYLDYEGKHHYNYGEGVSYPHGYNPYGEEGHSLSQKPVTTNQIYSPALASLSKQTEYNLNRLKQKLCKIDPCYEYGVEHWHTDHRVEEIDVAWKNEELPAHARPQWETTKNLFTDENAMKRINFKTKKKDCDDVAVQSDSSTPVSVCYLCSTLEEHQQHLVRRGPQLKEKHVPKPRVKYFAPPPLLKKKPDEVEEKKECLYKVTVVTGKLFKSGTNALVSVIIKGQRGIMQKRELTKKRANFTFGVGTSEVFYIKGPNLGDLRSLVVEHDGLEQKHGWFLEYMEVHNMTINKCWVFMCKNWLSLYDGDGKLKRVLRAQRKEMYETEYEITVITADRKFAGTDANVYITLYGKKAFTPKEKLESKGKNLFERGNKDRFTLITKELGPISSIKLEHDNSGLAAGWLVEQVIVHDVSLDHKYVFPIGQWLATDEGDGTIAKVFYPITKKMKENMSGTNVMANSRKTKQRHGEMDSEVQGEMIYYQVSLVTGNKSYAGTDAKVYIQLIGKRGKTHEEYLPDDNSEKFEKGKTDIFKFRATDVGDLKKLHIRHDNSGLGAGWFLEKVSVRRFFSQHEIDSKFSKMQEEIDEHVNRRVSEISGKDIEEVKNESGPRRSLKYSGKFRRMATLDEDEEEDERESNRSGRFGDDLPKEKRTGRRKNTQNHSDESDDDSDIVVINPRRKGRRVHKRYVIGVKEFILTETESDDDSDDTLYRDKRKKHRRGKYDSDEDSGDDNRKKRGKKGRNGKYDSDDESDDGYRKKEWKKQQRRKSDSESDDSDDQISRKLSKNRRRKTHSDDSESEDDYDRKDRRKAKSKRDRKTSDSESDSDNYKRKKKGRHGNRRYASHDSDEEESFAVTKIWKKDRIPYCDEYVFPCHHWLAEDEEDGAIARTLKPESCTSFYRMARK